MKAFARRAAKVAIIGAGVWLALAFALVGLAIAIDAIHPACGCVNPKLLHNPYPAASVTTIVGSTPVQTTP